MLNASIRETSKVYEGARKDCVEISARCAMRNLYAEKTLFTVGDLSEGGGKTRGVISLSKTF